MQLDDELVGRKPSFLILVVLAGALLADTVAFGTAAVNAALLVDRIPAADEGLATSDQLEAWRLVGAVTGIGGLCVALALVLAIVAIMHRSGAQTPPTER